MKGSELLLLDVQPTLVRYYIDATNKTYTMHLYVHKRNWSRFMVFEDDLRDLHVPSRDYAYTTSKLLQRWCAAHKFGFVPMNVFLGDWALSKFMKVWQSDTVNIETAPSQDDILHSELMVARMYIHESTAHYVRMMDVVNNCRKLLSPAWYELYITKDAARNKFINRVLEMLCEEYNIPSNAYITTYSDIIEKLS